MFVFTFKWTHGRAEGVITVQMDIDDECAASNKAWAVLFPAGVPSGSRSMKLKVRSVA